MAGSHGMLPEAADPITAFSQQLGIHPDEADEFGWLAEVGLQSPLPPRWTSHADASTGFVYYVDHDRQVSSWENPLVPYLRRIVEIGRAYLQTRSEEFFDEQKGILWQQHKYELDCWHGPFSDGDGRSYYVNSTAGVSSWQDPRVDAQYVFELESGLLTTLAEVLPAPEPDTPGWGEADNNNPWKTTGGAEVLTLDDDGNRDDNMKTSTAGPPERSLQRKLTQSMANWSRHNNRDEHKSALEKMAHTAEWLRSAQQDELEAQRLQFARKIEARKKNRARAAARPVGPKLGDHDDVPLPQERTAFSAQLLGPMPGQEASSPTSRVLEGRPVPIPLDAPEAATQAPTDAPTLANSPVVGGFPTPEAMLGDTPSGSPAGSPEATTPRGSPEEPTPGSPAGSPAAAPQPPSSPVGSQLPPPPPPVRGAAAPIVEGINGSATSSPSKKPKSRLFATLAAAAAEAPVSQN